LTISLLPVKLKSHAQISDEPFSARLDSSFQEHLNLFYRICIARSGIREFSLDRLKVRLKQLAATLKVLLQEGLSYRRSATPAPEMLTNLSIEVEQIKGKEMNSDGDLLDSNVLALAAGEILKRQHPLLVDVPSHDFAIHDKVLSHVLFDALEESVNACSCKGRVGLTFGN
jgi:hypothetical protein